jgi:hypothetical protein
VLLTLLDFLKLTSIGRSAAGRLLRHVGFLQLGALRLNARAAALGAPLIAFPVVPEKLL